MSVVNLPQETQTRKIQSLSDDQRKIAEELIAEKFDIREEVVQKEDTSFREHCTCGPEYATRCRIHDNEPSMGYGRMDQFYGADFGRGIDIQTRVDFQTRRRVSSIAIGEPTTRAVRDGLMRLDMENLPRHDRKLYASPQWLRALSRDEGFRMYVEVSDRDRGYHENVIGRIFGLPIVAVEGIATHIQVMY